MKCMQMKVFIISQIAMLRELEQDASVYFHMASLHNYKSFIMIFQESISKKEEERMFRND